MSSTPPVQSSLSLLEKTQKLVEVERLLTMSLEKVEPWLTSSTVSASFATRTMTSTRVRPIPATMDQVHEILAVARNLSTRTSAPAGWNPHAPVVGFSTPNPLPHQLRGGVLGALELDRARQAELQKQIQQQKRKRKAKQEEELKRVKQEQEEAHKHGDGVMQVDHDVAATLNKYDPKAVDAASHRPATNISTTRQALQPQTANAAIRAVATSAAAAATTTMNLSDSSSDEDEDDSD